MISAVKTSLPLALVTTATIGVAWLQLMFSQAPLYGYDEAWHLYLSSVAPLTKALEEMAVDPHPLLYYLLIRPLAQIGPEPFWPRLLSVLPTILTVPLWYLLLRKLDLNRYVAAALTLVLAASHGFNELGLTIRAYSLTALCFVAALWFWCDFMGVDRARPTRASLRAVIAFLTAAFWLSYYAVFFSIALVAASLLAAQFNREVREVMVTAWRRFFRWPEGLAVAILHGGGFAWFMIGYGRAGLAAPPHVSAYILDGQQSLGSFLAKGLRGYVELFTPLGSLAAAAPAAVVVVLAVSLLWVVAVALRRGATAHAALLLSIPLVLAILFAAGVVGFYPFGGYLRHQHLVLLLFLLALGIGLNDAYERIQSGTLRAFALGVVVAIAVGSSVVAARRDPLGEFPESQPLAGELKAAFEYGEESTPVYTAVYPFYVIYADRFAEGIAYKATYGHYEGELVDVAGTGGFLLRLRLPREWDEYQVRTAPGRFVSLYRDRTLFHFPDEPGASVFSRLHELMAHRGLDRLRILRAVSEETLSSSVDVLGNAFARHGFDVLETQISDQGETWLIRRR